MKQNTEKHWYLIVLALVIVEMVNLHIIAHFAPFWVPMILSGLVGIAMLVYAGFLYRSIRTKYRNYLERKNEELSAQISKLDFTVHDLWQYINGLHQQAEERANRQLEQLLDDSKQRAERALEMMKSNKTELTSLIQTTESALQNEGKRRLEALQRDLEALGVKLTDHHTEHREWMQGQAEAFSKEMAAHNEAITALQRAESEQAGRRTETLLKQIDTQSDANRLAISETAQMLSKAVSKTEDSLTQSGQQQMDDLTGRLEQLEQTMIQRGNAHTDLLCQEFQAFENRYMERSREESEERSQEQRELRSDLEASASHTGEQLLAVQQTLLDRMQEKEALDRETVSRQTEQWETMQDTLRLSEQENRSDTQKLL